MTITITRDTGPVKTVELAATVDGSEVIFHKVLKLKVHAKDYTLDITMDPRTGGTFARKDVVALRNILDTIIDEQDW